MPTIDLNSKISDQTRVAFQPILAAVGRVRSTLASNGAVVSVRAGYHYPPAGNPVPAVVVGVFPGTPAAAVNAPELAATFGVPVSIVDAAIEEQLAAAQRPEGAVAFGLTPEMPGSRLESLLSDVPPPLEFAPPKAGAYEPLDPPDLPIVDDEMETTICVSPEAGWSQLQQFLAGTRQRLTVAMYQFTAPHIFKAVEEAVRSPGREFELVLHPIPEPPARSGVKAEELDEKSEVLKPLGEELQDRFQFSWATLKSNQHPDGLWASAYHIKVAVRDGNSLWLSSGNWQSSNQPDADPFADPQSVPVGFQRKYNRDYHAIIKNDRLAGIYEKYIKRDHDLTAGALPLPFTIPEVFVPVEEEASEAVAFAAPPRFFKPLHLNRRIKVQPLLTPDNFASHILELIKGAQASVWFQNQYINFRDNGDDFPEFQALVGALKDKVDEGKEVRIICRDLMKQSSLDVLIALGFPRDVIRFQPACHNKTIIVDRKTVAFGSHNWSNEGVKTNRDASLIFFDEEIADYLAGVYENDWDRLATARPSPNRARVARDGEKTPAGMQRVPVTDVVED